MKDWKNWPFLTDKNLRKYWWVWAGGLVLIIGLMIYSVNYTAQKEQERERIVEVGPTEEDFDRWGFTCMETLVDLYGELPDPDLFAGCVMAYKYGQLP
jgi:hypothetical protein